MQRGISSLLFELASGRRYLIPQAILAEIVPADSLTPVEGRAEWLSGKLAWRGQLPAVIDPGLSCGADIDDREPVVRYAILYALEHLPGLSYYAFPLASLPHPVSVVAGDLVLEPSEEACEMEMYQLRLDEQLVAIPNFMMLERRLASQLASID